MEWPSLVLLLSGLFAAVKLYRFSAATGRLLFKGLMAASLLFCAVEAALLFAPLLPGAFVTVFVEWGHVFCLAIVLSSLALFVRESKPAFARFPMLYTGVPLLIVFSYFLVRDTFALKEWLLSIYQAGAIVVALLMYGVYQYRLGKYLRVLGGVALMGVSFTFYWLVPGLAGDVDWLWQLTLAGGIVLLVHGYEEVLS